MDSLPTELCRKHYNKQITLKIPWICILTLCDITNSSDYIFTYFFILHSKQIVLVIMSNQKITQPFKKKEILPFAATMMDFIVLSEVSQTEKDKYHVISLILGI